MPRLHGPPTNNGVKRHMVKAKKEAAICLLGAMRNTFFQKDIWTGRKTWSKKTYGQGEKRGYHMSFGGKGRTSFSKKTYGQREKRGDHMSFGSGGRKSCSKKTYGLSKKQGHHMSFGSRRRKSCLKKTYGQGEKRGSHMSFGSPATFSLAGRPRRVRQVPGQGTAGTVFGKYVDKSGYSIII